MKTVEEKIEAATAKVERAKLRTDRAVKRYYSLLGWGTSAEVEHASKAVSAATEFLTSTEAYLARLQRQLKFEKKMP